MTTIKEKSVDLKINSVDAIIEEDEIIPGISGKVVDIEQSYQAMKKVGMYHTGLLVYKEIEPAISIEEQYDKYVISGNKNKKMISLIFKVESDDKIDSILKLLDNYKISVNFFIDGKWLEGNSGFLREISSKGHVVGNLGYLKDYEQENNYWAVSYIKRNTKQSKYYCYSEEKNNKTLESCTSSKQYTILPKVVITSNLLVETKKSIESGSIISIDVNDNNISQLTNTIDFIKAKGYDIVNLDTLLEE